MPKPPKRSVRKNAVAKGFAVAKAKPANDGVVVGIGASAGGVQAFNDFFKTLPVDTGMSFVIVQHLDPNHESLLPEILARDTAMKVVPIRNQTPVMPNHVYVLPPNREVTIQHGVLSLQPRRKSDGHYMAIDRFLQSLARDRGNRAVAVILS